MQTIALAHWGTLAVFGNAETGAPGAPALPVWLPAEDRFRAARLTVQAWPDRPIDYIAVWPADEPTVPDPGDGTPWTVERLDGVLLAQAVERWRCAVCANRVNALAAESAMPILNQFTRHHWATHCPHCGAHVDQARLHALVLLAPTNQERELTAPPSA